MKTAEKDKKIVWAVDPFCEECPLIKQTARSIGSLASEWGAEVEPVYLLSDVPPNVKLLPDLVRDVQSQAQNELQHLLQGIQIPRLKALRMIGGPDARLRDQVDQLVDYARKSGADLIAVGTRARSGPVRWLLGSFAETLLSRSDVPLFVINPSGQIPSTFSPIFFPTDFSEESKEAYGQVIQFARQLRASITLFHRIRYDPPPAVEVAFSGYPLFRQIFENDVDARKKDAEGWVELGRAAGVEVESIVDYHTKNSVSESILLRSRNRGGMIAMAAHSGPLTAALLGSTTRQVVRSAECPVWVVHAEHLKESELPPKITEADVMSDLLEHGRGQKKSSVL